MKTIVQISLDLIDIPEALDTAHLAVRAGVDWLEAGSPLDQLREVVQAVKVPVQAVGGLSVEQAVQSPEYGAPLVVLGAPLTIDANSFKTAGGDLESKLRLVCEKVHAYGDIAVG